MKNLLFIIPILLLFSACREENPCKDYTCYNAGTPTASGTVCGCDCPPGFSGPQCEQQDLCFNVTCYNGGTCSNGVCNCPEGYGGSDCSNVLTANSVSISRVEISGYPQTDGGAGWDISDGPDCYIDIYRGSTLLFSSGQINNAYGQTLIYTSGLPQNFTSISQQYTIYLYDYDSTSSDDYMDGATFTPATYSDGNPSNFQFTVAGTTYKFFTDWNY